MRAQANMNFFLLITTIIGGGEGRRERDGGLRVELEFPKYPKVGDGVVLGCKFDLGTDTLYTVKWYKGNGEFYRFTPKESPTTKVFPFQGLDVDERYSNATHLVLRNVDLNMSGKYSCEVTTDAPDFTTDLKSDYLTVLALPTSRPELSKIKGRASVGDFVDINCSSFRSKPGANLTWYINNRPAHMEVGLKIVRRREDENYETSYMNLHFQVKSIHFIEGRMSLKCTASIYDRYSQSSEVVVFEEHRPKISSIVDNSSSSSTQLFSFTTTQEQSSSLGSHRNFKSIYLLLLFTTLVHIV